MYSDRGEAETHPVSSVFLFSKSFRTDDLSSERGHVFIKLKVVVFASVPWYRKFN